MAMGVRGEGGGWLIGAAPSRPDRKIWAKNNYSGKYESNLCFPGSFNKFFIICGLCYLQKKHQKSNYA